jgi:hypothetical protein
MAVIAVYRFISWDPDAARDIESSRFATLKAIHVCNGRNIEDSRRLVDTGEVDASGYYQAPTSSKAAARSA